MLCLRAVLGFVGVVALAGHSLVVSAAPPETRPVEGLREKTPAVYALTGLKIVVRPGVELAQGTVVVRDGVLEAVGADITPPAEARVLDLTGKTAYAGFVDAYSTQSVAFDQARGTPYWNGEIRPQLSLAELYQVDESHNERLRRQGFVARLVAPDAGIVKGRSALVTTGQGSSASSLLAADVALHMTLTIPFARGGEERYPNSPMGAVALARQAMYDADWYGQAQALYRAGREAERPQRDDALEALQGYAHGDRLVMIDAANELYCLRAAAFAKEFSLRMALHGSGNEYRRLDAIRALGVPVIVPVDFPKPPNVTTAEAAQATSLEELMHWDHAPENPARLAQAGVPIAFTSAGLRDVGEFMAGVRKAVKRGLSADQALAALTTTPAELYGVASKLGTLEAGKAAHLVIADGDLFAEKTKVVETWVDGRRFEWDAAPEIDPRGQWEMTWDVAGQPRQIQLELTGEPRKLAGTLTAQAEGDRPAINVKLAQVGIEGARLAAVFPSTDLGRAGTARLSAVISVPAGADAVWSGAVVWPDGSPLAVTARRTAGATQAKTKDDEQKTSEPDAKAAETPAPQKASVAVNYPLGAYGRAAAPAAPRHVLFTNATIWTCGPEGTLRNASLLIGDGKILAVGQHLATPPEAIVVDAKGLHISPGIIDCHSHMATDGGVNESGQAVTAEVRIGDFIDCDDMNIYRQLAGGVTAANILHGSANPIGGQNQVIKLRWGGLPDELKFAEAPAGIKFALGENVKQSNSTNAGSRYPQSRMGVEQLMRDEFQAAREYQQARDAWARDPRGLPPRRDLELDAIAEILAGQRWIHCHSYRQDEILALLRTCEEFQIQVGTLQHILEGYKVADAMAKHGAMGSAFSDWWAYKFEVYDAIPFNGALMHRAGVVVSFNSDDRELARHLNHEAAKAVKYGGVPPEEALKFVTLNPARQLRIDAYVGSLEPGKQADLAVWSDSPLSTFSRCEQTWVDGRKYFDRAEDLKSREEVAERRALLIQKVLESGEDPRQPGEGRFDPSELWPRDDLFCHHHDHDDDDHLHQHEAANAGQR